MCCRNCIAQIALAVVGTVLLSSVGLAGAEVDRYERYENERSALGKMEDGLQLLSRLITSNNYSAVNDTDFLPRNAYLLIPTFQATVRLIRLHRTLESNGFFRQSRTTFVVGEVSRNLARDACRYLTKEVSNWYKNFSCSSSQLEDIETRFTVYDTVRTINRNIISGNPLLNYSRVHQCSYWNTKVANRCTFTTDEEESVGNGNETSAEPESDSGAELVPVPVTLREIQRHFFERGFVSTCRNDASLCRLD